jgi:hypothetical protein
MGKTLSRDLRERVIAAVEGGWSRRAAAERFGVSVATAIRWVREFRLTGATHAKPKGGDQRSHRIEACGGVILTAITAQVDNHPGRTGRTAAPRSWRPLCPQHGLALPQPTRGDLQKKPRTPASRTGPTSPSGDTPGSTRSLISTRRSWSSSMRPARPPKWPACAVGPNAACGAGRPCRMGIGRPRPSQVPCDCPA